MSEIEIRSLNGHKLVDEIARLEIESVQLEIEEIKQNETGGGIGQLGTGEGAEIFNNYNEQIIDYVTIPPNIASGKYSHAENLGTHASGDYSHAEGRGTKASLNCCHAEGDNSEAEGEASHAEGMQTRASGMASHVEGLTSFAGGISSHAEGNNSQAQGDHSHAEGMSTIAEGEKSHAEGDLSISVGEASHAEGNYSVAYGIYSHAEGQSSFAFGEASHSEGYETRAHGIHSHAEGEDIFCKFQVCVIAEEVQQYENGNCQYRLEWPVLFSYGSIIRSTENTENYGKIITPGVDSYYLTDYIKVDRKLNLSNDESFEIILTGAIGTASHSEGSSTYAVGDYSHAEGYNTVAVHDSAHSEGVFSYAAGAGAHAEGGSLELSNLGYLANNKEEYDGITLYLTGPIDDFMGACYQVSDPSQLNRLVNHGSYGCNMLYDYEGQQHVRISNFDKNQGLIWFSGVDIGLREESLFIICSAALADGAHAEGTGTLALSRYSHAEGQGTVATCIGGHVSGRFNKIDEYGMYAEIVGGGTENQRANIYTLDTQGNAWFSGDVWVSNGGEDWDTHKLATEDYVQQYVESAILGGEW